jgi:hypothetical protein
MCINNNHESISIFYIYIADVEGEKTVSVMLNGEESEITFFKMNNTKVSINDLQLLLQASANV